MRKAITALSVAALTLAGTAWAGEKKESRDSKVARAMAVAEIDFELHRAQLGLVGSSLLSEGHAKKDGTRAAAAPKPTPAPIAIPLEAPSTPAGTSDPRN